VAAAGRTQGGNQGAESSRTGGDELHSGPLGDGGESGGLGEKKSLRAVGRSSHWSGERRPGLDEGAAARVDDFQESSLAAARALGTRPSHRWKPSALRPRTGGGAGAV